VYTYLILLHVGVTVCTYLILLHVGVAVCTSLILLHVGVTVHTSLILLHVGVTVVDKALCWKGTACISLETSTHARHLHAHEHKHIHTCTNTHTHTLAHTSTHTLTHTSTHTDTHTPAVRHLLLAWTHPFVQLHTLLPSKAESSGLWPRAQPVQHTTHIYKCMNSLHVCVRVCSYGWPKPYIHTCLRGTYVGLARIVNIHRVCPYICRLPCQ